MSCHGHRKRDRRRPERPRTEDRIVQVGAPICGRHVQKDRQPYQRPRPKDAVLHSHCADEHVRRARQGHLSGAHDLADQLGLPQPDVSRSVQRLLRVGFLRQTPKNYKLSKAQRIESRYAS
ncbi:helix-turn-helix domain-containing protein [Nocardia sp. NPDC004711]